MPAYMILVTDEDLVPVGDPIASWTQIKATLRFNEPGSGSFTAPATDALAAQLLPSNRIVVIRDGTVLIAGPYETSPERWSADDPASTEPGQVTVHFADDLALVAGRITYPDPSEPATNQIASAEYTDTDLAETLIRDLVNLNAGPGALVARQVPGLVLGTPAGIGATVKLRTRFAPLLDVARTLATVGGGTIGFRTVQVGQTIEFQTYETQDLTGQVRFSRALGNLRAYEYQPEAPRVTAAIVGGQGEGTARTIRERLDSAAISAWWRLETFVDQRNTNDTDELDQAGDEALADGAETAKLTTVTVDTADQRALVHYQLGDRVSVELRPGLELADVVRIVEIDVTPEQGERVVSTVGTQQASSEPEWVAALRAIDRRVGHLEVI